MTGGWAVVPVIVMRFIPQEDKERRPGAVGRVALGITLGFEYYSLNMQLILLSVTLCKQLL